MLGSAVSSRTPSVFQPSEVMAPHGGIPLTKPRTEAGPHLGWPHCAVGMHRALESAMGLPNRPINASRMLRFVTPPDVRSSFKVPPARAPDTSGKDCRDRPLSCG